jgi:hypothetical protein
MTSRRRTIVSGVLAAALLVAGTAVYADSAAQIYVGGCYLRYVKHVNDLPSGETTLDVRNTGPEQQVRIKFGALAEGGANLSRTIDAKLRCGEQRTFWIHWGEPITDLNFIQIIPVGPTQKKKPSGE